VSKQAKTVDFLILAAKETAFRCYPDISPAGTRQCLGVKRLMNDSTLRSSIEVKNV